MQHCESMTESKPRMDISEDGCNTDECERTTKDTEYEQPACIKSVSFDITMHRLSPYAQSFFNRKKEKEQQANTPTMTNKVTGKPIENTLHGGQEDIKTTIRILDKEELAGEDWQQFIAMQRSMEKQIEECHFAACEQNKIKGYFAEQVAQQQERVEVGDALSDEDWYFQISDDEEDESCTQ
jgi:hypothetical protein